MALTPQEERELRELIAWKRTHGQRAMTPGPDTRKAPRMLNAPPRLGVIAPNHVSPFTFGFGRVGQYTQSTDEDWDVDRKKRVAGYLYKTQFRFLDLDTQYLKAGLQHGPTYARLVSWDVIPRDENDWYDGYVATEMPLHEGVLVQVFESKVGFILVPVASGYGAFVPSATEAVHEHTSTTVGVFSLIDLTTDGKYTTFENDQWPFFGAPTGTLELRTSGIYDFDLTVTIRPEAAQNGTICFVLSILSQSAGASAVSYDGATKYIGYQIINVLAAGPYQQFTTFYRTAFTKPSIIEEPYIVRLYTGWFEATAAAAYQLDNVLLRVSKRTPFDGVDWSNTVTEGITLGWPVDDSAGFQSGPGEV